MYYTGLYGGHMDKKDLAQVKAIVEEIHEQVEDALDNEETRVTLKASEMQILLAYILDLEEGRVKS